MTNLFGLTLSQLRQLADSLALPSYTARQIADWLYSKRVVSIDQMTNLSLKTRELLKQIAFIGLTEPVDCQASSDGTKKYLFSVGDGGHCIECVYIPEYDSTKSAHSASIPSLSRATLCVSCQAGCKMGCHFCVTGQQGFHGNLSAAEIINQVFSIPESDQLTNIVFMGMGEPMDNLEAVLSATEILVSDWGLGWSPHRITVSTVGIIPSMERFLQQSRCHIAVSLHNAIGEERLQLMPAQRAYPIANVIETLRRYDWSGQRRLSFEYTMFHNINDDTKHAAALVKLLNGLHCRVNLIRFHSSPDMPYRTSSNETIQRFRNYLEQHSVLCTIRASRGEDISAACGLLAGSGIKK